MTQKAVVKNADMTNEMQQHAVEICAEALRRYDLEKDIASYVKKDFERKYGPTWHCIVGRSYGRWVDWFLAFPNSRDDILSRINRQLTWQNCTRNWCDVIIQ